MPNLNRVMLMGNLTRDPELRYTPNNHAVCHIGLAINRFWKDPTSGERKEEVSFIDCEAWGRTAEVINQYLRKGRPIYIEGRLKLDQWQDKEGNNRSKLKVVVESFEFIDSKAGAGSGTPGEGDGGGYSDGGGGGGPSGGGAPQGQRSAPQQPPQQRYNNPPPQRAATAQAPVANPQPPMSEPHQPMDEEHIPF